MLVSYIKAKHEKIQQRFCLQLKLGFCAFVFLFIIKNQSLKCWNKHLFEV